ncbi:tyrosine-protein phosphatase [Pseudonocardia kunmingensis]|uniref:Protein tyrosine/serine phosphatase n=1 Tax=Pseudonocardia kunmingensis TaxID=630975 RepID=A0A543DPQ9_9PSEU|nr:tyrosine-protein phosphatase [Pseudonocardia kunmingensis]TQM11316.1 protein tyrosine/serine phosphatase [Pseudonocardia kunmingensis]
MASPAPAHRPRWIDLDGAHNVRDVGGLRAGSARVRDGVLLRGDHLEDLTPPAADRLCDELGLRAIIDLRGPREDPRAADWIAASGVARLHLPLVDLTRVTDRERSRGDVELVYRAMLDDAGPALAQILRFVVADDRTPALVHCAAGKDRTGITVAVLLAVAGVDSADIVADYVATGERLARVRASLVRRPAYRNIEFAPPSPAALSDAPIRTVLSALDAHAGGAAGFLAAHGTTAAEMEAWRAALLAPA